MENACGFSSVEPPLSPRSPPASLDLYGKRRQLVKVQVLEREIGLLQEELKSIEDLQPASRCCKELHEFVGEKPDPLITISQKTCRSKSFWKRFWGKFWSNFLCWHCSGCCQNHQRPQNCTCYASPKSQHPTCSSLVKANRKSCCRFRRCSCLSLGCACCCCFKSPFRKWKKVNLCSNSVKCCHITCCL